MLLTIYNQINNFLLTVFSLIKVLLFSNLFQRIKPINQTLDCLILGNGPSLKSLIRNNYEFLKNKDLFCVNYFPLTSLYEELRPKYFITSAPELWRDDLNSNYIDESKKLFETIKNKTNWELSIFIPFEAKKYKTWKKFIEENKAIKINYYNVTYVDGFYWFREIMYKYQLGMPRVQNVLIPAIMIAIRLGYKNIYLWGADHSWLSEIKVDENNNVLVCQKHFYDEESATYQKMRKLNGTRKLHEVLYKFMHTFKSYHYIEEFASKNNINIYNATPNSYIDAFKRIKMS